MCNGSDMSDPLAWFQFARLHLDTEQSNDSLTTHLLSPPNHAHLKRGITLRAETKLPQEEKCTERAVAPMESQNAP